MVLITSAFRPYKHQTMLRNREIYLEDARFRRIKAILWSRLIIFVSIGANLLGNDGAAPLATCRAAADQVGKLPYLRMAGVSRWYSSAPVPASAQPDYVNGMVMLAGEADPARLLADLHAIEALHHRRRSQPNAARTLDLDLIAMGALIREGEPPLLPHPRAHLRAFVLRPWFDLAPFWKHPVLGKTVGKMLRDVSEQEIAVIG